MDKDMVGATRRLYYISRCTSNNARLPSITDSEFTLLNYTPGIYHPLQLKMTVYWPVFSLLNLQFQTELST